MTKFFNMFPELSPLNASIISVCSSYGSEEIFSGEIMINNFFLTLYSI